MHALVCVLFVGAVLSLPSPKPPEEPRCGYESCTPSKPGVLNVHIVPHTHDDVGWLKTVDQYYYGNRNDIQKAGVQYILDSVIKELWEDPARRFVYVETAFFVKWWQEQTPKVQDRVRTLVASGRLQFAGGAWAMNDEANTYYQSTVDQFTYGLSFLNKTFGACGRPRVGWQIDPFGHSREFASILAASGFDGLFLGRIDFRDKSTRMRERDMEFLWRGDDSLGKSSDIFTGILYNTYSPPPGFCFDVLCNDEPIVDDPKSPDYNVDRRVDDFLRRAHNMSMSYLTNNILVTMGDDFNYQDAGMWFKNLDKLINRYDMMCITPRPLQVNAFLQYVNQAEKSYLTNNVLVTMGGDFTYQDAGMWYKNLDKLIKYGNQKASDENLKVNLFYSTPHCYLKAVKDFNPILPIKQDDFFPYASDAHSYWSGYFTSRPAIKFIEAEANRYTQMVKQLAVLAELPEDFTDVLDELKSAMGILQHHDAITGTEKQHVTSDYIRIITQALAAAHDTITTKALNKVMLGGKATVDLKFDRCQFNESSCQTSETAKGNLIVTVYNPLAWPVLAPVSIPTLGEQYSVRDASGKWRKVQTSPIFKAVVKIPTRESIATHEATFLAQIPALGYKSFYLKKTTHMTKRNIEIHEKIEGFEHKYYDLDIVNRLQENIAENNWNMKRKAKRSYDTKIVERFTYNDEYAADQALSSGVDLTSGTLKSVLVNDKTYTLKGNAAYYKGFIGNNMEFQNRSSGAYIFRPESNDPVKLEMVGTNNVDGDVFMETQLFLTGDTSLAYRTYKDERILYNEINWVIGPISDTDGIGKEYVFQFESNIVTNGELHTDSNGRQVLKRKLNQRPQYNLTLEEPTAGNYYPVVDFAFIEEADTKFSFNVLPDRPQGVASLEEGQLEVMLHRRLLHDDAFGVGEALNETVNGKGLVIAGKHRLFFGLADVNFKDALEMRNRPQVFVTDAEDIKIDDFVALVTEKSWLKESMPSGVHLLTLEPWTENSYLIRLENYLDKSDKSKKVVDLKNILKNEKIKSFKETLVTADKFVSDYEKWIWRTKEEFSDDFNKQYGSFSDLSKAKDRVRLDDDGFKITLDAKQIRTFIVNF